MIYIFKRKPKAPEIKGKIDFIVAGLGNPGSKYEKTRHNVGFIAVDALWKEYGVGAMCQTKCKAVYGLCIIEDKNVLVAKPQTFMNLSGEAVRDLCRTFKVDNDNLIIIYDDISLSPGKTRLRPSGSDGGHNGIKSIIGSLGTNVFPRIKIGIGSPNKENGEELVDYVLDTMDKESMEAALKTPPIVAEIIKNGIDIARQKFN